MRGTPFYYGWIVLAASAVSELLVQGATLYSAGLFILPLQAEFHISRAAASSAGPILFLGVVFMAPLVGRLLDRLPVRRMMVSCALVLAASMCAIAWTTLLMFTSMTHCQSFKSIFSIGTPCMATPALLNDKWISPNLFSEKSAKAFTESASDTSVRQASTLSPSSKHCCRHCARVEPCVNDWDFTNCFFSARATIHLDAINIWAMRIEL